MSRFIAICCASLYLAACATLTPGGQQVRVTTNADVVRGCRFVGNVSSGSGFGGGAGQERTQIDLQNKTAQMGGNVLYLATSGGGWAPNGGAWASGEAYFCTTY